ncbi:MAG: hypothetical protein KIH69_023525 [Anaerolineae bacterium]|nr:hypothetical protein [Anaerolineae bacterium]
MDYKTVLIGWLMGFLFLSSINTRHIQPSQLPAHWRTLFNVGLKLGLPIVPFASGIVGRDLMGFGQSNYGDYVVGFSRSHWMLGLQITLILILLCIGLLWLADRSDRQLQNPAASPLSLWQRAIYDEVHWLFYRAVPVLLLNDLFYGSLIGSVLICAEIVIQHRKQTPTLKTFICVAASSLLYIITQNIGLMLIARLANEYAAAYFANSAENKRFIIS